MNLSKAGRPAHARDDDPEETGEATPGTATGTASAATGTASAATGTASDATSGTASDTAVGTAVGTAAGTASDSASNSASNSAVGTASDTARAPRPAGPAHADTPIYRPRHAKRRRRRWPVLVAAGVVLVALAGAGAAAMVTRKDDGSDGTSAPAATHIAPAPAGLPTGASGAVGGAGGAGASGGPSITAPAPAAAPGTVECRYNVASDKTPQIVPPTRATRSGLVKATIGTSRGPVTVELDATNAPCTVESFLTLAAGGYFSDTACHRLTTQLIFVLQCGDPTALGSGDPGYSFDDENLPAPGGTPYPRGTLAMANAGPDTNGSQFFIVYKDSPIDPNYPVFGKVTGGLEIVDRVAAGGAPGNDGQPNESLVIQAVQVS